MLEFNEQKAKIEINVNPSNILVLIYYAVSNSIKLVMQLAKHKAKLLAIVLLVVGNVLTYVDNTGGTDINILVNTTHPVYSINNPVTIYNNE